VNNSKEENWRQSYLADQELRQLLEKVDADVAENVRKEGCTVCDDGVLHRAKYPRKPRGVDSASNETIYRLSFCCNQDGCRKRHTPPSVRFLGRRVYSGFVMVLVSTMRYGLTPERFRVLYEGLGIDRRTVERWRQWWLNTFEQSVFWKAQRAQFSPTPDTSTLPWSLWEVFGADRRDRLLDLLKFLSPLTTQSIPLVQDL